MSEPRELPGARRIGPGVYVTPNGALRLSAREVLLAAGYAHTPENEEALARAMQVVSEELGMEYGEEEVCDRN